MRLCVGCFEDRFLSLVQSHFQKMYTVEYAKTGRAGCKLCTGKIVCAVCSEEFQTKRLLERHGIKQHAVKLVYRCHVCGRNYRRPDKYQLHKKKCADRYESDSMFSDYDEDDSRGGDPLKLVTINLFSKKFDLYDYKQEKLC